MRYTRSYGWMDDLQFYALFSSPGRSPGRTIVLPPVSALALVSALASVAALALAKSLTLKFFM